MASQSSRSPRAARVVCGPHIQAIVSKLSCAFGGNPVHSLNFESALDVTPVGSAYRDFAIGYLSSQMLSKYADGVLPDAEQKTWSDFWKAETQCGATNQRLYRWATSPFSNEIVRMRSWIARALGKFNPDECFHSMAFGPGATTRLPRRKADLAYKFTGLPHATHNCAILGSGIIDLIPAWRSSANQGGLDNVVVVEGNRITMVPKNRKKHRMIAIEPDLNMFVQKGIGAVIRRKLRAVGVDLNDQTRNQRLARQGSNTGELGTIDLSMASDTVAKELVEVLLPPEWLSALGMCRSEFGVLPPEQGGDGKPYLYRKWSSMGNGYTFELESLIFSAVVYACSPMSLLADEAAVYGDDIVVPVAAADHVLELLRYLGFTPNADKSWTDGPFRESCGKHYFLGLDVTPFYVKQYDRSLLSLMKIHNQIRRLVDRWDWIDDPIREELLKVCAWLRSYAPAEWRKPTILDGLGDGAFVGSFDEVLPNLIDTPRKHKTWSPAFYMPSFVVTTSGRRDNLPPGALTASLWRLERHPQSLVISDNDGKVGVQVYELIDESVDKKQRIAVKSLRVQAHSC